MITKPYYGSRKYEIVHFAVASFVGLILVAPPVAVLIGFDQVQVQEPEVAVIGIAMFGFFLTLALISRARRITAAEKVARWETASLEMVRNG